MNSQKCRKIPQWNTVFTRCTGGACQTSNILYKTGSFAAVPLGTQIEALCTQLIRSYAGGGSRIKLQARCADVALDLDRAVPLLLIVNELVSNAMKHAFPGDRTGRVAVELFALPGARYRLLVADDGIGLPASFDLAGASSLGLQLVNDLVEQLGATAAVHCESGTTSTLSFLGAAGGEDGQP